MKRMCFWFKSKGSVRPCSSTPQNSSWKLVSSEETTPGAPHQEFWEKNRFIRTRNQHIALAGPTQPGRLRDIHLRDLLPVPFSSISLTRECERKAKINISAGFVKISVYMGTKYREGKSDWADSYPGNCRVLPSADEALVLPLYMPS